MLLAAPWLRGLEPTALRAGLSGFPRRNEISRGEGAVCGRHVIARDVAGELGNSGVERGCDAGQCGQAGVCFPTFNFAEIAHVYMCQVGGIVLADAEPQADFFKFLAKWHSRRNSRGHTFYSH